MLRESEERVGRAGERRGRRRQVQHQVSASRPLPLPDRSAGAHPASRLPSVSSAQEGPSRETQEGTRGAPRGGRSPRHPSPPQRPCVWVLASRGFALPLGLFLSAGDTGPQSAFLRETRETRLNVLSARGPQQAAPSRAISSDGNGASKLPAVAATPERERLPTNRKALRTDARGRVTAREGVRGGTR